MSGSSSQRPYEQEWQPSYGDRWEDWASDGDEPRRRGGRVGLISASRVLLVLVVIIAGAVALYGLFIDQSPLQLPIIITGSSLAGITLLVLALSLARASIQLARRGRMGRAIVAAFFGGLCVIGAAGALAGAIVLAMLTVSA